MSESVSKDPQMILDLSTLKLQLKSQNLVRNSQYYSQQESKTILIESSVIHNSKSFCDNLLKEQLNGKLDHCYEQDSKFLSHNSRNSFQSKKSPKISVKSLIVPLRENLRKQSYSMSHYQSTSLINSVSNKKQAKKIGIFSQSFNGSLEQTTQTRQITSQGSQKYPLNCGHQFSIEQLRIDIHTEFLGFNTSQKNLEKKLFYGGKRPKCKICKLNISVNALIYLFPQLNRGRLVVQQKRFKMESAKNQMSKRISSIDFERNREGQVASYSQNPPKEKQRIVKLQKNNYYCQIF